MVATLEACVLALSKLGSLNLRGELNVLKINPWCGRHETSTKEDNIDRPYYMMVDNRRLTINQIDKTVSIFPE